MEKTFLNTKSGLLSLLCSIFDLLGIVSPCLIEPKLIIQELWKRKVDWDDELPSDLKYRFQGWRSQLRSLPRIFINRYYGIDTHTETTELHFLADSSNQAYGVVVHLRYTTYSGMNKREASQRSKCSSQQIIFLE